MNRFTFNYAFKKPPFAEVVEVGQRWHCTVSGMYEGMTATIVNISGNRPEREIKIKIENNLQTLFISEASFRRNFNQR